MTDLINIFIIEKEVIPLENPNFLNYTNGWQGQDTTMTDSIYPSLTGYTGQQSIMKFKNWEWRDGRMYHTTKNIGKDDTIFQEVNLTRYATYKITFNIKGNTNPNGYIQLYLGGDTSNNQYSTDGTYTDYIKYTGDYDDYNIFRIYPTNQDDNCFLGSIGGITITNCTPIYKKLDLVDSEKLTLNY